MLLSSSIFSHSMRRSMTCSPPDWTGTFSIHLLCRRRVGQLAEQHRCRKPQLQVRSLSEFLDRADGWRLIYQFELWVGRRPAWPSQRQSRQGTRWRPFRHLDPHKQWRSHDNDADRSRLQRRCGPRRLLSGGRISGEQSAGASRSRPDARTRHPRVELRFWVRDELVRARRCLRGSPPVRRWRQGRHTLPVVRGNPSPSPSR